MRCRWSLKPESLPPFLLARLPTPAQLSWGLKCLPAGLKSRALTQWTNTLVCARLSPQDLHFMQQRSLAIEVEDLALRWVFTAQGGRLQALPDDTASEATIRGQLLDLLLLASQLEDADTLFFQRRLKMSGDTALGLEMRNFMDQQVWSTQPQGLRILLNRLARLALAAQAARAGRHQAPGSSAGSPQGHPQEAP